MPVQVLLLGLALWLGTAAFREAPERTLTVTDLAVRAETRFAQFVVPAVSALYPDPEPLLNEPFFYLRLLDDLYIEIETTLEANPAAEISGSFELIATVVAPERWERTFVLREAQTFRSEGPVTHLPVFHEMMPVSLSEYQDFIALVEEETRVLPRSDYRIDITAVVEVDAADGSTAVNQRFEFPLAFRLAGSVLYAEGQYEQRRQDASVRPVTMPGTVAFLGSNLSVRTARVLSTVAGGLLAGLLGSTLWVRRGEHRQHRSEAERILQRHRSRVVEVQPDSWSLQGHSLALASFKDLLRVADHFEQTIFFIREDAAVRFVVIQDQTVYSYTATVGGAGTDDHPL